MKLQVKIFIVVILLIIASLLIVVDRFKAKVNPDRIISPGTLQSFTMKVSEPTKEQVDKIIQKIEDKNSQAKDNTGKNNYIPSEKDNEEIMEEYSKTTKEEIYEVQSGDTFYSLSKRFYGTSKYANKLFEYNKYLVKKPESLKIGIKLRIPEKSILEKKDEKIAHK